MKPVVAIQNVGKKRKHEPEQKPCANINSRNGTEGRTEGGWKVMLCKVNILSIQHRIWRPPHPLTRVKGQRSREGSFVGALDDEVLRSRSAEESELCLNCCASLICYFPLKRHICILRLHYPKRDLSLEPQLMHVFSFFRCSLG